MIPVHPDIQAADEFLAALFAGVCCFSEEDETGAGSPGWFAKDSLLVGVLESFFVYYLLLQMYLMK